MNIDVKFDTSSTKDFLKKYMKAISAPEQSRVVHKAAEIWKGRLIRRTPKRWTGQTRRSWVVNKLGDTTWEVTNTSKTMSYLESGTKAHGPKTAKALFIPLTKRAFLAGPKGVMMANKAASAAAASSGKKGKKKPPFVVGKDFVFAKRVRGIRAMNIVRDARVAARNTLRLLMTQHLVDKLR